MNEEWYVDRARLRDLMTEHPDWSGSQLAAATNRSLGWVKKWRCRLRRAAPDDNSVLRGHSCARRHPPEPLHPDVLERILDIRDHPPEQLRRTPGPRAILYYLHRDETLKVRGHSLPRSPATIWRILRESGRIRQRCKLPHEPLEQAAPMVHWQIDFKDVTTVPPEPGGKQAHVVEVLDVVDAGTSILVDALPRQDYTAETALLALASTLLVHGLPKAITFDRDTRFVGSWSAREFPSAFMRFLDCLDIAQDICPPRRPDKNPFVERYHRTYEYECLRVDRPADLEAVDRVTAAFQWHYNTERPNQARSCGNRPPFMAFPELPILPTVPDLVDPDRWLQAIHRKCYRRRVDANGVIYLGGHKYYIRRALRGRQVVLRVDAPARELVVALDGQPIKRLAVQALHGAPMPFQEFVRHMAEQARQEWRKLQHRQWSTRWLIFRGSRPD